MVYTVRIFVLICFIFSFSRANASDSLNFYIVSKDSPGDFPTIQEAFSAIPDSCSDQVTIYIRNGTYKEKLVLPENPLQSLIVA